jgi:alginate O-acetyltransferase complex protein AlgI
MAIGIAKCLGYDLQHNFNMPYISKNVTEFWKRWHISLSEWLQQYLYIPMGGSRRGTVRRYINLMVTMLLGGLWHGANYTFVVWGTLHGAALCIHKLFLQRRKGRVTSRIGTAISVAITYIFVCICWVFFRAPNFQVALDVLTKMFIWTNGITQVFSWSIIGIISVVICTLVAYVKAKGNGQKYINGYYVILDLTKTFQFNHHISFFNH